MSTNTNIKDATTFAARADNLFFPAGKTVGNAALARFAAALKTAYAYPGGGDWPVGRPDANDAAAWFYKHAASFTKSRERATAQAAVAKPDEFEG